MLLTMLRNMFRSTRPVAAPVAPGAARPAPPPAPPLFEPPAPTAPPVSSFVAPHYAHWNKEYSEPPFDQPGTRSEFDRHVRQAGEILRANHPGSGAFLADDMLVWFRNASFLSDPDFLAALGPLAADLTLRARLWRLHLLCWAARNCLALDGDYMDVGCYDGKTVAVVQNYCSFAGRPGRTWWMYDIFDEPPQEARKSGHGPRLYDEVRGVFEPLGNFRVIKGAVPHSFAQGLPQKIAFAHIDLNVAQAELACLETIYDRIVPSGIVVFDDFGFRRYRDSQRAEAQFLAQRGQFVWESPTGQGLWVKR